MHVLPYLMPYKNNDFLCLHENNYQNILMAHVMYCLTPIHRFDLVSTVKYIFTNHEC